jgi:hypothetical protein
MGDHARLLAYCSWQSTLFGRRLVQRAHPRMGCWNEATAKAWLTGSDIRDGPHAIQKLIEHEQRVFELTACFPGYTTVASALALDRLAGA